MAKSLPCYAAYYHRTKETEALLKILTNKIKEALLSVLPVTAIVFFLNLTPLIHFSAREMTVLLICSLFLILGIGLFNLGADLAMTPMGEHTGAGLTKSGRLWLLLAVCFTMGLLITVAEPDLSVLASQVSDVINPVLLIIFVAVGVGLFLLVAMLKIVFGSSLSGLLMFFYMLLFALAGLMIVNGNGNLLSLVFDSGGVTTGPVTVPFIMALGVGIAATLGGRNVGENSFGLIALCSVGPMLAVAMLGITVRGDLSYQVPDYSIENALGKNLFSILLSVAHEVILAIALILLFFAALQIFVLKLPRQKLVQIAVGILYTVVGLIIFLTSVTVGFMPVGYKMGAMLAGNSPYYIVLFGFIIGTVTVLAEPAVHVLNKQVEEVTNGTVGKKSMMAALSVGVGISIGLSMLRTVLDFNILYYLIPGYFISLGLSFFVPGIYTAIAFDSGGVASGPLTSSFILPFAVGVCCVLQGESHVMTDAFGIVAMVAMTPLITIQILGFRAILTRKLRERIAMKRILGSDDEQIIDFM